jgi:Arc/MetJ family transcription regulator
MASRCYDAVVSKTRTTLTIDEDVLRAVKVRAARSGKGDSEVIEEALRRDLGIELLDRLWARNDLPEAEAVELAVEAQHASRRRKR